MARNRMWSTSINPEKWVAAGLTTAMALVRSAAALDPSSTTGVADPSSSSGLSGGAIAGIVIGCSAFVACCCCCYNWWQKNKDDEYAAIALAAPFILLCNGSSYT